ncbi:MAG: hypothetical protein AAF441_24590 [Pseudomonadota bacterium]
MTSGVEAKAEAKKPSSAEGGLAGGGTTRDNIGHRGSGGDLSAQRGRERSASEKFVSAEQKKLCGDDPDFRDARKNQWTGLALSGGGIRSSTFCLGILQALAKKNWLQDIDYLSTVSGGGFVGSSLHWWWHGDHGVKNADGQVRFGTRADSFPYGTSEPRDPSFAGDKPEQVANLNFLRTHGHYLTPGNGITVWSGIAVVVRTILLNLLVWIPLSIALFALLWLVRADWPGVSHILELLPNDGSPIPGGMMPARWSIVDEVVVDALRSSADNLLDASGDAVEGAMANVLKLPPFFALLIWSGLLFLAVFVAGSGAYAIQTANTKGSGLTRLELQHYLWWWVGSPLLILLGYLALSYKQEVQEFLAPAIMWIYATQSVEWLESAARAVGWVLIFIGAAIFTRYLIVVIFRNMLFKESDVPQVYFLRRFFELVVSRYFKLMLVLLIIGLVPVAFYAAFFATSNPGLTGLFSLGAGVAAALWGHARAISAAAPGIASKIFIPVGSGLFLFGLAVLGYELAMLLMEIRLTGLQVSSGMRTAVEEMTWTAQSYTTQSFAERFFQDASAAVREWVPFIVFGLIVFGLAMAFAVNVNQIGLNRFYRDRLMESYMPNARAVVSGEVEATSADKFELHEIASEEGDSWARVVRVPSSGNKKQDQVAKDARDPCPYPLINTNCVLVNDPEQTVRLRGGDNFLLSPLYCGARTTEWYETKVHFPILDLATGMATSGAAANPNAGFVGTGATMGRLLSIVMMLLNIRLGFWIANPNYKGRNKNGNGAYGAEARKRWFVKPLHFFPGAAYALSSKGFTAESYFLELSDGGHFDNSAMYELIRRRCKLIIACDGEADSSYGFAGFNALQRRIAEDFNARITFDKKEFLPAHVIPQLNIHYPDEAEGAERAFFLGKIEYAPEPGSDTVQVGRLIYIKSTMIENLSFTARGYKAANPAFPHETTADQFFNTEQFDVYRELGYYAAMDMIDQVNPTGLPKSASARKHRMKEAKAESAYTGAPDGRAE